MNGLYSHDYLKNYLLKKKMKQKGRQKMSHELLTSVSVSAHILYMLVLASLN